MSRYFLMVLYEENHGPSRKGKRREKLTTGKNLRFPIYVYNMVFGCLFNVFQETRKRNNFQFQDTSSVFCKYT